MKILNNRDQNFLNGMMRNKDISIISTFLIIKNKDGSKKQYHKLEKNNKRLRQSKW